MAVKGAAAQANCLHQVLKPPALACLQANELGPLSAASRSIATILEDDAAWVGAFLGWGLALQHPAKNSLRCLTTFSDVHWYKTPQVTGAEPCNREGHVVLGHKGYLLIFGGRSRDTLADCWAQDIASGRWIEVAVHGEKPPGRWFPKQDPPVGKAGLLCDTHGNDWLIVHGGLVPDPANPGSYLNAQDSWIMGPLGSPRNHHIRKWHKVEDNVLDGGADTSMLTLLGGPYFALTKPSGDALHVSLGVLDCSEQVDFQVCRQMLRCSFEVQCAAAVPWHGKLVLAAFSNDVLVETFCVDPATSQYHQETSTYPASLCGFHSAAASFVVNNDLLVIVGTMGENVCAFCVLDLGKQKEGWTLTAVEVCGKRLPQTNYAGPVLHGGRTMLILGGWGASDAPFVGVARISKTGQLLFLRCDSGVPQLNFGYNELQLAAVNEFGVAVMYLNSSDWLSGGTRVLSFWEASDCDVKQYEDVGSNLGCDNTTREGFITLREYLARADVDGWNPLSECTETGRPHPDPVLRSGASSLHSEYLDAMSEVLASEVSASTLCESCESVESEPAEIPPEEAAHVANEQWATWVESQTAQSTTPALTEKTLAIVLTFGRHPRSFDSVLSASSAGQRVKAAGESVKPSWANGAKVLVVGLTQEIWQEAATDVDLCPYHVILSPEDQGEVKAALAKLPSRKRPCLKPGVPALHVPQASTIDCFHDISDAVSDTSEMLARFDSYSSSDEGEAFQKVWITALKDKVMAQTVYLKLPTCVRNTFVEAPDILGQTPRSNVTASAPEALEQQPFEQQPRNPRIFG